MFEEIMHREGNTFYDVKQSEVDDAQKEMGVILPKDLIEFYKEVGYGFLKSYKENINRIMDPNSVCEFRFREGQFVDDPELEIYESFEKDKLIFFEVCEGYYLAIGFSKYNRGKIYDGKTEIADSLKDFLDKYQKDEEYFLESN